MTMRLGSIAAIALLVSSGCAREPQEYLPPPAPPRIDSFVASATAIKPGEQVTLSFATKDATESQILDQRGQPVTIEGSAADGTAVVTPTETSFYVLRVMGAGGRDSAFVRIDVADTLREATLLAIPPSIHSGDEVQLVWAASNASEVTLIDPNGETLAVDAAAGAGMVTVRPTTTSTFRLTATSPNAPLPLVSEATVVVSPVISEFTASPTAVQKGQNLTLAWKAGGSGTYTVTEATFGPITTGPLAANGLGSFQWTVPERYATPGEPPVLDGAPLRFTLTVESISPAVTLSAQAKAKVGNGPELTEFVAPLFITRGDAFQLRWKVEGASHLRILRDSLSIYEPLPGSAEISEGTYSVGPTTQNQTFELEAEDTDGNVSRAVHTVTVVDLPTVSLTGLPAGQVNANSRVTGTITSTSATRVRLRFKDGPQLEERVSNLASFSVSVQVASTVTLVAEAENAAGRKVRDEKTVRVGPLATGTAQIGPNPALGGGTLTLDVEVTSLPFNELPGVPTNEIRSSLDAVNPVVYDFVDLSDIPEAHTLEFSDKNDGITRLEKTASFAFPFVGTVQGDFWVSTNGFVAFANVGALSTPASVAMGNTVPPLIAPFWMDLAIPSPSTENPKPNVYYLVEGTTFPRTLIVQWNDMSLSFAPAQFTFQVQLSESGTVKYLYKRLASSSNPASGGGANGENATIGVNLSGSAFAVQHSIPMTATVANNQAIQFLNPINQPINFTMPAWQSGMLRFFGADLSAAPATYAAFALPVRVFRQGDVEVSEVMANPDPLVGPDGTWIELFNRTPTTLDLSGLTVTTTAMDSNFTIPVNTLLSPGGHLLLAASSLPGTNGGLPAVDLSYGSSLTFTPALDTVSLIAGSSVIASLSWSSAAVARSVVPPVRAIPISGGSTACPETTTYGTPAHIGSPRAVNRNCFGYELAPITVSYNDIFLTGTPVWPMNSDIDSKLIALDLSSAPVKLFGVSHNEMRLSSNGFLVAPGVTTGATTTFNFGTSTKVPTSSTPNASVVIFGDDLDELENQLHGPSGILYKRVAPGEDFANPGGHWIFQWHHVEHWNALDDLNMQVKWFDDGAIEFHYAVMTSGSTANYADGNSATVWIENVDGTAALSVGTATTAPAIASFTAYRFTPATITP